MITTNQEIDGILRLDPVVAIGVSGGKDSNLAAYKTKEHLVKIGYKGEAALWHAGLGSVEWEGTEDSCRELAMRVELPLFVVRRKKGGLMERFRTRWANNVHRYVNLLCAKLILPWSTPSMRFCTSELKTTVICSELKKRYAGQTIVNVTGIRRAESAERKKAELFKINKTLIGERAGTFGYNWNSIIDVPTADVVAENKRLGLPWHQAYWLYNADRFSCAFCIMGSIGNLLAAAKCESNHPIYIELCSLEAESLFSFQSNLWLSDIAPHLLNVEIRERIEFAKYVQKRRDAIQKQIPKHLLFVKGKPFPQAIPTASEAVLLSEVRKEISRLHGLKAKYLEPGMIVQRYRELMRNNEEKLKKL